MVQKNRYARGAKISNAKFRLVAQMFSSDASAVEIAKQTGLNRNTVNRYTQELRKRIIENFCKQWPEKFIEETLSHFGVLVTDGKICVEPISNEHSKRVRRLISGKLDAAGDENVRRWREYDGLLMVGCKMQIYLNFGKAVRTAQPENVAMTEDFFVYVKERVSKFYGVSRKHFFAHLKECEFRYNHRNDNIYDLVLEMTKERALFSEA